MKYSALDNRGMILVFTLLLLGVFLSTALAFSYFVIGNINKARAIDDSIIAYYSADAGMEESLYLFKKQSGADTLDLVKSARAGGGDLPQSKGKWDISESTNYEQAVLRQRLHNGQSAKFFILNRATATNPTKSITFEWYKGGDQISNLQVNLSQLSTQNASGTLVYYTDLSDIQVADSCGTTAPCGTAKVVYCKDLNNFVVNGTVGQRLPSPVDYLAEFKVLGATDNDFVERLYVKAYDKMCSEISEADSPDRTGITNLTLKSKGSYGRSSQSIIAQILPRDPVSGLLGFVLFSEMDVVKE